MEHPKYRNTCLPTWCVVLAGAANTIRVEEYQSSCYEKTSNKSQTHNSSTIHTCNFLLATLLHPKEKKSNPDTLLLIPFYEELHYYAYKLHISYILYLSVTIRRSKINN